MLTHRHTAMAVADPEGTELELQELWGNLSTGAWWCASAVGVPLNVAMEPC